MTELAAQLHIDLEIQTRVDNETLVRLYNRAQFVIYTPIMEPFGLVALEAMACGTPVIAVREGGVRESIVHNETGVLVERDEGAFAEAMINLLSRPQLLAEMRTNCRPYVLDHWNWDAAVDRIERELLSTVLQY